MDMHIPLWLSAPPMQAVNKDLMAMKVAELKEELKEELEARGEGKTGNKAWLRRRLHAAIVREHLDAADSGLVAHLWRANFYAFTFYENLIHMDTFTLLSPKGQTFTQPPPPSNTTIRVLSANICRRIAVCSHHQPDDVCQFHDW